MTWLARLADFRHSFFEPKVPASDYRAVLKSASDEAKKNKALEAEVASLKRALAACELDRNGRVNAIDDANRENARINARIADAIAALQS